MHIANRRFRPTLAGTLATLVMLPVLIGLGLWQLRRAEEKRELMAQFSAGASTTQELDRNNIDSLPLLQSIVVRGRYDGSRQVLLDNMPSTRDAADRSAPGYHVLTPLIDDARQIVLIDRGWLPLGRTRRDLPEISVAAQPRAVRGRVADLPRAGIHLSQPPGAGDNAWPKVLNFPTMDELRALYGGALLPKIVLLDPQEADGFQREWSARFSFGEFGPERHVAYAVQWFGLAATLVVLYFVVNLKKSQ